MTKEEYHKHDETNLLIAEFMGMETSARHPRTQEWTQARFDFHNSWNALMPVVDKINQGTYLGNPEIRIGKKTELFYYNHHLSADVYRCPKGMSIECVYCVIAHFIEWHNENKQQ